MNFVANIKSSKAALSAVAVAAALAAPGAAQADAVAQAILDINNFKISLSNPGAIASQSGTSSGDTKASLVGYTTSTGVGSVNINDPAGFSLTNSVGPDAGLFSPLTAIVGAPTGTFSGSHSAVSGSALGPAGARASVDNVVSLFPAGDGSAEGNVSLTSNITFTLTGSSTVSFAFDAVGFLRSYLDLAYGATGEANADYNWALSIRRANAGGGSSLVVRWEPNGAVTGNGVTGSVGGTETQDDFDLTDGLSITDFNADDTISSAGSFAMTTNTLTAGTYFLSISHSSDVNAFHSRVSEPQVLALAGLALLGAGAFGRRRRA